MRLEEVEQEQKKLIDNFLSAITNDSHVNRLSWIPNVLILLAESLSSGGVVRGAKLSPYLAYEDKKIAMAFANAALELAPRAEKELYKKIISQRYKIMTDFLLERLGTLSNKKYEVGYSPDTLLGFLARASRDIPEEEKHRDAREIISILKDELTPKLSKTKKTLGVTNEQQIEKFKQVLTDCFSNRAPIAANDTASATDIREFLGMMLLSLADILNSAGLRGNDFFIEKINNQAFDFLDFLDDDDNLFMLIDSECNTKNNVFPEDNKSPNEEETNISSENSSDYENLYELFDNEIDTENNVFPEDNESSNEKETNISSENSSVASESPLRSALKKPGSPKERTPKNVGWTEDENGDVKKETVDYNRDIEEYNFMHSEESKLPKMYEVDPMNDCSKTTFLFDEQLRDMWVNRKKLNPGLASNVNYRVSYWRQDLQKTSCTKTEKLLVPRYKVDKKTGDPTEEPIAGVRYTKLAMRRNR